MSRSLRVRAAGVAVLVAGLWPHPARATFSIAVADSETGALGSAGASCVGPVSGVGAFILSDIVPGLGVIHTQASYLAANQSAARERFVAGDAPAAVLEWVAAHDAAGNPGPRQYGIVDLQGTAAGYTGSTTTAWAGHRTGPGYAIQGNILSGAEIVADMESAWLATPGDMAARLMAALEAAKVVGADTRCAARRTSTRSAFLRVVAPGEPELRLIVPDTAVGQDPIDMLQRAFDAARAPPPLWLPSVLARGANR